MTAVSRLGAASRPPDWGGASNCEPSARSLVEVDHASKLFRRGIRDRLTAVDDVSLLIHSGRTLGVVGESGSGKSTLARLVLGLERPTTGRILHDGEDISDASRSRLKELRRDMQVVLQDPVGSLNRRKTVEQIITAPLQIHRVGTRDDRRSRAQVLLDLVGLAPALMGRYPGELSGGQCQRVSIARALALEPRFIVLDEAVSALDVSVQAQVLNLLKEIQHRLSLTYLFISHDLAVIRYMSDEIAVMYAGRVIEFSDCERLFAAPAHPYTALLMNSLPGAAARLPDTARAAADAAATAATGGQDSAPKGGCRFRDRCLIGRDLAQCRDVVPLLSAVEAGHYAECHFPNGRSEGGGLSVV